MFCRFGSRLRRKIEPCSSDINMAQQQHQQLRQLIQSVPVLTDQLTQEGTLNVNAEVFCVFGRSQGNPASRPNLNQPSQNASFSHFRRLTNMLQIGTSNTRNRANRSRSKAKENLCFTSRPRQGKRVALTENGHVFNHASFP